MLFVSLFYVYYTKYESYVSIVNIKYLYFINPTNILLMQECISNLLRNMNPYRKWLIVHIFKLLTAQNHILSLHRRSPGQEEERRKIDDPLHGFVQYLDSPILWAVIVFTLSPVDKIEIKKLWSSKEYDDE